MASYSRKSLQQALNSQVARLSQKINKLEKISNNFSLGRLLTFVGGLGIVYLAGVWGPEWLFWISIVAFIAGFGWLVRAHKKVDGAIQRFTIWKTIRQTHLSRMRLDWPDIPERHPTKNYSDHPYASDLNITGRHSLLQLLDTSTYQGSTDKLAGYLLTKKPVLEDIKARQAVVKELATMPQFRDQLHLYAELHGKQQLEGDWSLEQLLHHLEQAEIINYRWSLLLLGGLAAVNILLGLLYLLGIVGPYAIFSWVLYLVIYNFNSEKIQGLYHEASQLKKLLSQFNGVLHFLETFRYEEHSRLKNFCRPFWTGDDSPSRYLKRIIRIAGSASSQQSEVVWVLLNFLVPWDLYFAQKLSSYKQELAPRLSRWLKRFYKLEALSAMATFAWLHPQYTFALPDRTSSSPLDARELGHPLIPPSQKVTNDITINAKGALLLITGSNMAGKSTFLRTIGINLALCFSGAPVNAVSFSTLPSRLFTSINVSDSLDDGLSHFYAEVKRLRTLLGLLENDHPLPLLFMVDEIYRGTNNRERLQGSRAFLQQVAGKNGVGLVSTHDLELAQLEDSIPELSNWHFAETIEDGKMSFEYKLKPGPCPSTNALKIMEMEGLPT